MNSTEKINFFFEDTEQFELDKDKYREWINKIIKSEGSVPGFLNVIFVSDKYILQLNKKHLNSDYYTDVISFDYSDPLEENICGDIFISIDTVKANAKKFNQETRNEILRIVAHGLLHLLGYDDKTDEAKNEMKSKEDFYLEEFC